MKMKWDLRERCGREMNKKLSILVKKTMLTNVFRFAIIFIGDSAFVESLSGRMRHRLKARLR